MILESSWNELNDKLNGNIIFKIDDKCEKGRNQFLSKYNEFEPDVIIECESENDVIESIKFLNKNKDDITFRIRSGGHSYGGYSSCTKCVILDLSKLKNIHYDINNDLLCIEPGITQYEFVNDKIHIIHNISIPHGNCPSVAFGGYSNGGGLGLMMRKYGINIDYLIGVNIVLFDGSLKQILLSKQEEQQSQCIDDINDYSDLLWAIKGAGGGNFGVITKYYFNPIPRPNKIVFVSLKFEIDDDVNTIKNMFRAYRWFYDPNNNPSIDFTAYLMLQMEEEDIFKYGYSMNWWSLYTPNNDMNEDMMMYNVYNIVNSIKSYLSSKNIHCMEEKTIIKLDTYSVIYNKYIFGEKGTYFWGPWKMVITSRFINKITDFDDNFIDKLSNKLYNNIVVENSWNKKGYGPNVFILEPLYGNVQNKEDAYFEKSSFYGRQSWVVVHEAIRYKTDDKYNKAKDMLLEYDTIFADNIENCPRYINYMDDIDKDLSSYYPNKTVFNTLKRVKTKYDPNNLFQFDMSIPCTN